MLVYAISVIADSVAYAIPGAALVVSMTAVALSAYMGSRSSRSAQDINRRNALHEEIDDLKEEIAELKEESQECIRDRKRLERENLALMKRVLKLENGNGE